MRIIKAIKCPAATLCVVAGRWKECKREDVKKWKQSVIRFLNC